VLAQAAGCAAPQFFVGTISELAPKRLSVAITDLFDRVLFVVYSAMHTPEITAYLKTYCGWSAGVRAVLAKYNLPYTEKDIIQNPAFRWEMETKSGQPLSPCVEVNGQMLADISGEEVERYLIDHKLVRPSDAATDVPTNAPCPTDQHEGAVKLNL
jgi:glutaredoxin-related protein